MNLIRWESLTWKGPGNYALGEAGSVIPAWHHSYKIL
jgi:hypothetical protein